MKQKSGIFAHGCLNQLCVLALFPISASPAVGAVCFAVAFVKRAFLIIVIVIMTLKILKLY